MLCMSLTTHQKSCLVFYDLIFFCHGIFRTDNTVITLIGISAGPTADQGSVDLTDSPVIGIAEQWKYMHQIMFFCKLCIWALGKMISGYMVLFIIVFRYIAKRCQIFLILFLIFFTDFMKNFVYQPHIKVSVQIKNLSHFYKSYHKQISHKLLKLLHRRMIRQQRRQ